MADYLWPEALVPFAQSFFLQSHTGRSSSPFTRQQKVYGLSAPLWVCRMSFRGGYNGNTGIEAFGPALDALIARLKGGQNRAGLFDFRRPALRGVDTTGFGNVAALAGATTLTINGLTNGETVKAGDYIGGDGRPHIIVEDVVVAGGVAEVTFEPPLLQDLGTDSVVLGKPLGWFRLTDDGAGSNMTEAGGLSSYDLEFIEDPMAAPTDFEATGSLLISGITVLIIENDVEME